MLNGAADYLSSLLACTHYLHVGLRVWAPLHRSLVRGSSDVSSTAACAGKWCCLLCLSSVICIWFCFCFTGQPRTVQEYVRGRVQSPTYIGYSPADDLSVEFEGWDTL